VTLGAVIARQLASWGFDDLPLERELFGSADPETIARSVDAQCRTRLGAGIDHYDFFDSSSGTVHGVTLTDGRGVVVKGHRAAVSPRYLEVVAGVQRDLADRGFPAPRPLAGPVAVGPGHLTIEEMLRCDTRADGHDPAIRAVIAAGLAEFVDRARDHREAFGEVSHPMRTPDGGIYPLPHSARFDFAATAAGAEWIDTLATRANVIMRGVPDGEWVVAHGDWRLGNVCVADGRLRAVYDWDSVQLQREPIVVASAVVTFSVDWSRPAGEWFPSPQEMAAFVVEYERARSRSFTASERRLLAASMVASLAYGARCEHADPGEPPVGDDCQGALLARLGAPLLDHGLDVLASS
jgi:phosphotransferase family enzyme